MKSDRVSKGDGIMIGPAVLNTLRGCKSLRTDRGTQRCSVPLGRSLSSSPRIKAKMAPHSMWTYSWTLRLYFRTMLLSVAFSGKKIHFPLQDIFIFSFIFIRRNKLYNIQILLQKSCFPKSCMFSESAS